MKPGDTVYRCFGGMAIGMATVHSSNVVSTDGEYIRLYGSSAAHRSSDWFETAEAAVEAARVLEIQKVNMVFDGALHKWRDAA